MNTKRLPRFKRLPGARSERKQPRPNLTGADPKIAEREPDELTRFARDLGGTAADYKIARRVINELKPANPAGSKPELVTYDWLESQNIRFTYQAMLYGGRRQKGGLVPDFVVESGGGLLAWLVQGEYYHNASFNDGEDLGVIMRLTGAMYQGQIIRTVVQLWERDIYRKRPLVFQQALLGVGLRG